MDTLTHALLEPLNSMQVPLSPLSPPDQDPFTLIRLNTALSSHVPRSPQPLGHYKVIILNQKHHDSHSLSICRKPPRTGMRAMAPIQPTLARRYILILVLVPG